MRFNTSSRRFAVSASLYSSGIGMAIWLLNDHVTNEAISELVKQTPRATAIVGAAILEAQLSAVVLGHFPVDGETKRQLFMETGLLGNMDIKIKLAYITGILSKTAFQDFQDISTIRNRFAHRLHIAAFDHAEVKGLCTGLRLIKSHAFPIPAPGTKPPADAPAISIFEPDLAKKLTDPRECFLLTLRLMCEAFYRDYDSKPPALQPLI